MGHILKSETDAQLVRRIQRSSPAKASRFRKRGTWSYKKAISRSCFVMGGTCTRGAAEWREEIDVGLEVSSLIVVQHSFQGL